MLDVKLFTGCCGRVYIKPDSDSEKTAYSDHLHSIVADSAAKCQYSSFAMDHFRFPFPLYSLCCANFDDVYSFFVKNRKFLSKSIHSGGFTRLLVGALADRDVVDSLELCTGLDALIK